MSGGNILVPIVAHVVYDLLTFLEVHQRATAQLETAVKGNLPQKQLVHPRLSALLYDPTPVVHIYSTGGGLRTCESSGRFLKYSWAWLEPYAFYRITTCVTHLPYDMRLACRGLFLM